MGIISDDLLFFPDKKPPTGLVQRSLIYWNMQNFIKILKIYRLYETTLKHLD